VSVNDAVWSCDPAVAVTVMLLVPVGVWAGMELEVPWLPQPVSCVAAIPVNRARISRKNRVRGFFPASRRWPLRVARESLGWMVHVYAYETGPARIWVSGMDDEHGMQHDTMMPSMTM
jgi:hypothetical protein